MAGEGLRVVVAGNVSVQGALLDESLLAELALVRFDARVLNAMSRYSRGVRELHVAEIALVGFFSGVQPHVLGERSFLVGAKVADGALVWLESFVLHDVEFKLCFGEAIEIARVTLKRRASGGPVQGHVMLASQMGGETEFGVCCVIAFAALVVVAFTVH